ncbi:hypothetical protein PFUGPA_00855 [Plasmodium falciparum Palo Alto/Uganda]|uniref:Uncharacterized protein n=2 Tax=Plasmodium falciparum TaxID=5833 RepID=W4J631_PLAFP|nr:hypothetical protein PFUGPA_00855 [Plasmodium falciparum Palo Alto/Uganda]ETW62397.1 hypothetical protein PFMC_01747 [Plasmodium falciparum CAMP/Malaysia]
MNNAVSQLINNGTNHMINNGTNHMMNNILNSLINNNNMMMMNIPVDIDKNSKVFKNIENEEPVLQNLSDIQKLLLHKGSNPYMFNNLRISNNLNNDKNSNVNSFIKMNNVGENISTCQHNNNNYMVNITTSQPRYNCINRYNVPKDYEENKDINKKSNVIKKVDNEKCYTIDEKYGGPYNNCENVNDMKHRRGNSSCSNTNNNKDNKDNKDNYGNYGNYDNNNNNYMNYHNNNINDYANHHFNKQHVNTIREGFDTYILIDDDNDNDNDTDISTDKRNNPLNRNNKKMNLKCNLNKLPNITNNEEHKNEKNISRTKYVCLGLKRNSRENIHHMNNEENEINLEMINDYHQNKQVKDIISTYIHTSKIQYETKKGKDISNNNYMNVQKIQTTHGNYPHKIGDINIQENYRNVVQNRNMNNNSSFAENIGRILTRSSSQQKDIHALEKEIGNVQNDKSIYYNNTVNRWNDEVVFICTNENEDKNDSANSLRKEKKNGTLLYAKEKEEENNTETQNVRRSVRLHNKKVKNETKNREIEKKNNISNNNRSKNNRSNNSKSNNTRANNNRTIDNEPVVKESIVNESVVKEYVVNESVVKEYVVNESITNESITNESITNESITNESIMNESITSEQSNKSIEKNSFEKSYSVEVVSLNDSTDINENPRNLENKNAPLKNVKMFEKKVSETPAMELRLSKKHSLLKKRENLEMLHQKCNELDENKCASGFVNYILQNIQKRDGKETFDDLLNYILKLKEIYNMSTMDFIGAFLILESFNLNIINEYPLREWILVTFHYIKGMITLQNIKFIIKSLDLNHLIISNITAAFYMNIKPIKVDEENIERVLNLLSEVVIRRSSRFKLLKTDTKKQDQQDEKLGSCWQPVHTIKDS